MEAGKATGQENYNPGIAYIVVSKRIDARFFSGSEQRADNPAPGLVVDNTVSCHAIRALGFLRNFAEGHPGHGVPHVVKNCRGLDQDFGRYPPASGLCTDAFVLQLAYLIGESITRVPHVNLERLPFYL